jgi:hypothetical protein
VRCHSHQTAELALLACKAGHACTRAGGGGGGHLQGGMRLEGPAEGAAAAVTLGRSIKIHVSYTYVYQWNDPVTVVQLVVNGWHGHGCPVTAATHQNLCKGRLAAFRP